MQYPISSKIMNNQQFSFELTPKYKYRQRDEGLAISIDPTNTLLVISSKQNIKIYQFKHGCLKQLQQVFKHLNSICILNFFFRKSYFISGSKNAQIFLWSSNLIANPKYITKLIGNSNNLQCLIKPSKSDELIIYGTNHKEYAIKFYSYSTLSTWSFIQSINEHSSTVLGLSINEEANKLISCGKDCFILIMECSDQSLWYVKQKISTELWGFRICFINNSLFAFLPNVNDPFQQTLKNIHFYIFSDTSGQFYKQKEVQIEGGDQKCFELFHSKYIISKQILLLKNGYTLNFIKFIFSDSSWECQLVQAINFGINRGSYLFGTMTEDGKYLITWDNSNSIQIRIQENF
ncbi:unnamed protein product [Paramecium sonneborni]|uniref:Uncharacterized protein n=1 Tax=Paramecium sonneborni TaxID=65129 RepID=A0A8S1R2T8_9CILI|nr:unnamed protein product [Paramecium sonneborni]